MRSVWRQVSERAEETPDKTLFAWLNAAGDVVDEFSFSSFVTRTGQIARHIDRELKLPVGARVLLVYPPGLEMIAAFFACVRLGLVPVPVYPPTKLGFESALHKMGFIAADCGASAVLTTRAYQWSVSLLHARHRIATLFRDAQPVMKLPWLSTSDASGSGDGVNERHSLLLFLQYTSGSTADPKGVMVPHETIIDNADATVDHLPIGVSWLPQYHDMGLIGYYLFFAIKGGTTYGFSPLDFIRRPALWLQAISRYRGTASSAPNFAYAYCLRPGKLTEEDTAGLDLSSLRFLMNAAEPVRAPVVRAFLDRFAPHGLSKKATFAAYGLAEYTLAVTNYGQRALRLDRAQLQEGEAKVTSAPSAVEVFSCGAPLAHTEVAIVRADARVPERRVGEIWVRGKSVCAGYWGRPSLSEEVFGATLEGKRWLRTGDLGFVDDGELFVTGRKKDLIIVQGQNLYPHDIEQALEEHPLVRKGGVVAFAVEGDAGGERVAALVELRDPKQAPDARELRALVMKHVGCSVDRVVFLPPRALPKTSSGKPRRSAAKTQYEEGAFSVLATHSDDDALGTSPPGTSPRPRRLGRPSPLRGEGAEEDVRSEANAPDDQDGQNPRLHPLHGVERVAGVFDGGVRCPAARLGPAVATLFAAFGLHGDETQTLSELGLDSLQLVDFAHALGVALREQGFDDVKDAVDVPVLARVAVSELAASLALLREAGPLTRARFRQALVRLDEDHRAREQELMLSDCERLAVWGPPMGGLGSPGQRTGRAVLLTGATGFFGPFLLKSLLEHTDAEVRVLVRGGADDDDVLRRRVLAGLRIAVGDRDLTPFAARVVPLRGDLANPRLGLTTRAWDALAEEADAVFHNGAWVNYLYDYATMREANVVGTHEVLRLATTKTAKTFNHISTTFIFGWSTKETLLESDTCDRLELLDFGYAQSKWVSEQLVLQALESGLSGRVFRPALLTPSVDGRGSHFDIAVRLLAFMLRHGLGTTALNQVSFCPVDVAAQNVVAVASDPATLGQTLHVTRDAYATLADVTALLARFTGKTFTHLPLAEFVPEVIARCRPEDPLFPLLGFFVRSIDNITAMEFKRYDNSNFQSARARSPIGASDPPLDDVVRGLLLFMRAQGLVDA